MEPTRTLESLSRVSGRVIWLPTSSMTPDPLQEVLACNSETQSFFGEVTFLNDLFLGGSGNVLEISEVTHWMPCPRLPFPSTPVRHRFKRRSE